MRVLWGHRDPAPSGVPHRQSLSSGQLEADRVAPLVI